MINDKLLGRSTGAGNAEQAPPTADGTRLRSFGSLTQVALGVYIVYIVYMYVHVCKHIYI